MKKNIDWFKWSFITLMTILIFKGIPVDIRISGDYKDAMRIVHEIEGTSRSPLYINVR